MSDRVPGLPDLAAIVETCRVENPRTIVGAVQTLVAEHGRLCDQSLNLVASHNRLSPTAKALLASSVADNILSGRLGARDHAGGAYVDALDTIVVELSKQLFGATRVEYRATSGALANGLALSAIADGGYAVMALPGKYGGHPTYREAGYSGMLKLKIADVPYDETAHSIDLDRLAGAVKATHPRLIIIGTAELRFPYPIAEINAIADTVGARILYDGAHVMGLIAGGQFQDPLKEGVAVLTGSTQKTLAGPIGGLILTNDETLGEAISSRTSGLVSNYHNNRIAALAITLAEMAQFGSEYATQVIRNAQTLAKALQSNGVPVVDAAKGYTRSHIVLLDAAELPEGNSAFRALEDARILTTRVTLPHTYPERRGIRLGTAAITRQGMKDAEMAVIARLIRRVLIDQETIGTVAFDITDLVAGFRRIHYCFDAP